MIKFEGREFDKIVKFDCNVIHLKTKDGASYFTVLPISSKEYRAGLEAEVRTR